MDVLISAISVEEASCLLKTGVDILDIKNVDEGSLGAPSPWLVHDIIAQAQEAKVRTSAALGDLPFKPGTAALAAFGAAQLGVDYLKAGLRGTSTVEQARQLMDGVRRATGMAGGLANVVAAGYADYRCFNGLGPAGLVQAAQQSQCDVVMVDTAVKNGQTLFDHLSPDEIHHFIQLAKSSGLRVGLAGSLSFNQVHQLVELAPDFVGVRGCVCVDRERKSKVCPSLAERFVELVHQKAPRTPLHTADE